MTHTTYLINLDRSPDRLVHASQQLNDLDIPFERVSATVGTGNLTFEERAVIDRSSAQYSGRTLSAGEIGCYFSHLNCLKRFLDTDSEICLVLEDDLELNQNNGEMLKQLFHLLDSKIIPNAFNVINLANRSKRLHSQVYRMDTDQMSVRLRNSHHFPFITTGLVWSRAGARRFLAECDEICRPIDVELQCWVSKNGRGWALDQALVGSGRFDSEIEQTEKRSANCIVSRRVGRKRHAGFVWRGILNLVLFRVSRGHLR